MCDHSSSKLGQTGLKAAITCPIYSCFVASYVQWLCFPEKIIGMIFVLFAWTLPMQSLLELRISPHTPTKQIFWGGAERESACQKFKFTWIGTTTNNLRNTNSYHDIERQSSQDCTQYTQDDKMWYGMISKKDMILRVGKREDWLFLSILSQRRSFRCLDHWYSHFASALTIKALIQCCVEGDIGRVE